MEINEEYKQIFLEESSEQLEEWEKALLVLEKDPSDSSMINQAFRAIHTIKGSAGFIGFEELQSVTHALESVLQDVRDNRQSIQENVMNLLFDGLDFCRGMVNNLSKNISDFSVDSMNASELLQKIELISKNDTDKSLDSSKQNLIQKTNDVNQNRLAIVGENNNQTTKIEEWTSIIKIEIEAEKKEAYLRLVLIKQKISEIGTIVSLEPDPETMKNIKKGQIFTFKIKTDKTTEEIKRAADIDQVNVISVETIEKKIKPQEQKHNIDKTMDKPKENINKDEEHSNVLKLVKTEDIVRVPAEKLDTMLNLVGELVVNNSGFTSITEELKEKFGRTHLIIDLEEKTESLSKVAWELQDSVMKVRMLPIGSVFKRFFRVVRDLAKMEGKDIELNIYGEETEIDKKIIDRIGEPLVHLIRNSVDHGIEAIEERLNLGKSKIGHIVLGAFQEGDHICIEVRDDGRGIDKRKILNKALEKGLIGRADTLQLSDREVFELIFSPGFSTADKVTDISGRGVGLDSVKRVIESLGGSIEISSELNMFTKTIIKLPLTMAIIQAILVEVGDQLFAFPLSSVKEVIKEKLKNIELIHKSMVIKLRDEVIPVSWLKTLLDANMSAKSHFDLLEDDKDIPIVIVDYSGSKMGVIVDKLLGREEIVIKSLSKHYKEVEGLAGASIMGNGRVALILDVESLIRSNYQINEYFDLDLSNKVLREEVEEVIKDKNKQNDTTDIIDKGIKSLEDTNELVENEIEIDKTYNRNFERSNKKNNTSDISNDSSAFKNEEFINSSNEDELKVIFEDGLNIDDLVKKDASNENTGGPDTELSLFDEEQQEIMEQINSNSALSASAAMSQLMNKQVQVNFPETKFIRIMDITERLGGSENIVVGIYVGIEGSIVGGFLLIIPLEYSFKLSDYLYRRKEGETEEIGEEELAALGEMGNILSASFINSIGDITDLVVKSDVPVVTLDMCESVIDSVLARFNRPGNEILLTETALYFDDSEDIVCYLLLFFDEKSMENLLNGLRKEVLDNVGN